LRKKIDFSDHEIVRCSNAKGIIKIPTQIVVRALRRSDLIPAEMIIIKIKIVGNWFLAGRGLAEERTATLCRIMVPTRAIFIPNNRYTRLAAPHAQRINTQAH